MIVDAVWFSRRSVANAEVQGVIGTPAAEIRASESPLVALDDFGGLFVRPHRDLPRPEGVIESKIAFDADEGCDEIGIGTADQRGDCAADRMANKMYASIADASNEGREMYGLILKLQITDILVPLFAVADQVGA